MNTDIIMSSKSKSSEQQHQVQLIIKYKLCGKKFSLDELNRQQFNRNFR